MEILRECEIVGRTTETYPTIPSQAGSKTYGHCTLTFKSKQVGILLEVGDWLADEWAQYCLMDVRSGVAQKVGMIGWP